MLTNTTTTPQLHRSGNTAISRHALASGITVGTALFPSSCTASDGTSTTDITADRRDGGDPVFAAINAHRNDPAELDLPAH